MNQSRCKGCKLPIRWVTTEANAKPMPLDPHPDPEGNVELVYDVELGRDLARVHVEGQTDLFAAGGATRWMPHHATCENWPAK